MRKKDAYEPRFEDWLFHVVLPLAAYAVVAEFTASPPSPCFMIRLSAGHNHQPAPMTMKAAQ